MSSRARYRDWDGKTRLVQATGDTRKSAERALKAKLADRSLFQPSSSALTPDSPFPDLVACWLEDLDLEDRLSTRTLQLYERNMQTLVMPARVGIDAGDKQSIETAIRWRNKITHYEVDLIAEEVRENYLLIF